MDDLDDTPVAERRDVRRHLRWLAGASPRAHHDEERALHDHHCCPRFERRIVNVMQGTRRDFGRDTGLRARMAVTVFCSGWCTRC